MMMTMTMMMMMMMMMVMMMMMMMMTMMMMMMMQAVVMHLREHGVDSFCSVPPGSPPSLPQRGPDVRSQLGWFPIGFPQWLGARAPQ